jgi:hypothetical protein
VATFVFAFRDNETGELVEVRTVADNQEKALKAFKLKAPAIDVSPPYSSGRRTSVLRPVVTGTDRLLCHTVAE